MKRLYVIVFLVIAAAGVLGLAIAEHSGYVLIAYKSFRYESSLWATLALLAVLWLVFWGIKGLIELVTTSSGVVNPWSRRNRSRRVQVAIEHGQLDLAEGRWASAQRHLHRAAEAERQPLLYYLGAARAANEQGHYEECDNLLERALERQPQAELAIALSHAQLQTDRGDTEGALATLEAMHSVTHTTCRLCVSYSACISSGATGRQSFGCCRSCARTKSCLSPNWLSWSVGPGVKTSALQRAVKKTGRSGCSHSPAPGNSLLMLSARNRNWCWPMLNNCASWALRSRLKKSCVRRSSATLTVIWHVSTD